MRLYSVPRTTYNHQYWTQSSQAWFDMGLASPSENFLHALRNLRVSRLMSTLRLIFLTEAATHIRGISTYKKPFMIIGILESGLPLSIDSRQPAITINVSLVWDFHLASQRPDAARSYRRMKITGIQHRLVWAQNWPVRTLDLPQFYRVRCSAIDPTTCTGPDMEWSTSCSGHISVSKFYKAE